MYSNFWGNILLNKYILKSNYVHKKGQSHPGCRITDILQIQFSKTNCQEKARLQSS